MTASDIRIGHPMMLWTRVGPVDFFDFVPGEPLADPRPLYESALEASGMRFASIEWVRRMKRVAGRPKDLLDLAELEKIHGPPPAE